MAKRVGIFVSPETRDLLDEVIASLARAAEQGRETVRMAESNNPKTRAVSYDECIRCLIRERQRRKERQRKSKAGKRKKQ